MINSFTYNGVSSEFYGLYVGGQRTFGSPQRNITKTSIPGRNGDLIRDNGKYNNVEIAYNIVVMDDFVDTAIAVNNWLLSVVGYAELTDTYHPDHFRKAAVSGAIDYTTSAYNLTGKAQVVFDCMPQRFLLTGKVPVLQYSDFTITNPTTFASKPLIRVSGTGTCTVTIGNQIITLTNVDGYIDIDCETMNCYDDVANRNSDVILGSQGFPTLPPGDTGIALGEGTSSVRIIPRWWEL